MIVFRCNAGATVGFGHLVRCRALAEALVRKGQQVAMFGPDRRYMVASDLDTFTAWQPQSDWVSAVDDARRWLKFAFQHNADFLVLDDYRADQSYGETLHSARAEWLQLESEKTRQIFARLVWNSEPSATPATYAPVLRHPAAKLLLGPRYAMLRPQFHQPAPRREFDALNQILLMFGAGDDRGAVVRALDALQPVLPPEISVCIVCGPHNPNNHAIAARLKEQADPRFQLLIDPPDLALLMRSSDLAVLAGGTSTFEAAACGLPTLIVTIADNQVRQAQDWDALGVAIHAGDVEVFDSCRLRDAFVKLSAPAFRQSMSQRASALVDGQGTDRVAEAVLSELAALTPRGRADAH